LYIIHFFGLAIFIAQSNIQFGKNLINLVAITIGKGNCTILLPDSIPLRIIRAALSGCISSGILNSFLSVISVLTKPGLTVITLMLSFLSSTLAASSRIEAAALLAE